MVAASELKGWDEALTRAEAQEETIQACLADKSACKGRLRSLHVIVQRGKLLELDRKLKLVNSWINRFEKYRQDRRKSSLTEGELLVERQQWVTLSEFLRKGGDCEDYATAKYQILRYLGVTPGHMRIVVVYDRRQREYHATLAVKTSPTESVLLDTDNRIYRKRPALYDYIYAINEDSIWDHSLDSVRLPRHLRRKFNI